MATSDELQQQIVSRIGSQPHETVVAYTIQLWESLATELIPIIGKNGFAMLFDRSFYLTQLNLPWLTSDVTPQPANSQFTSLNLILEKRTLAEAREASESLLVTFASILATLIGEPLMTSILQVAWCDDTLSLPRNKTQGVRS